MQLLTAKNIVKELLQFAGVTINGDQPWDIQIHDDRFYTSVLKSGSLGLGEAYMANWWECAEIDHFFEKVIQSNLQNKIRNNYRLLLQIFLQKFINLQTKKRSLEVGKVHYDLDNELFKCMLDSRMNYTCGYWLNNNNLESAQKAKLELTCQKLLLQPGMKVLDIGCGFGALAKYAAENFNVSVVGITISEQQYQYAQQNCAGLPVEIYFQDYRNLNTQFDRIVSLGMFEHVGHTNYRHYMEIAQRCLTDDGLFLLHTIGNNTTCLTPDPWVTKYIFPNGFLPSISQIGKAIEGLFVMEDWHNFGADYEKTLLAWHANFNQHWENIKTKFDDRFYRMWNYYLLSCAAAFRVRSMQLWQIVLSKNGVLGGYAVPREIPFQISKAA